MTNRRHWLLGASAVLLSALTGLRAGSRAAERFAVTMTDAEWRAKLAPAAYRVLRQSDTEYPYSSKLNDEHRVGTFACAGCDQSLYASKTKFDSGTGWPSFYEPLPHATETSSDNSLLMNRTEVHCSRCGGHLGHVFADGPPPTGQRYCMNGVAMAFHTA